VLAGNLLSNLNTLLLQMANSSTLVSVLSSPRTHTLFQANEMLSRQLFFSAFDLFEQESDNTEKSLREVIMTLILAGMVNAGLSLLASNQSLT